MEINDLTNTPKTKRESPSPLVVLGLLSLCSICFTVLFCGGIVWVARNPGDFPILAGPTEDIVQEVSSDPVWKLQLEDDFVNNIYGWNMKPTEMDTVRLNQTMENGKFIWDFQATKSWSFWDWPKTEKFNDFVAAMELQHTAGSSSDSYGIAFRISDGDFYYFEVNESGKFGAWLFYQDEYKILISGSRAFVVKPGEINQVAVKAVGSKFAFYINQQLVGEVEDSTLSEGQVGIILSPSVWTQNVSGTTDPNSNSQNEPEWQRSTFEVENFKVWVPANSEQAKVNSLTLLTPQPGRLVYMSSSPDNAEIYTIDSDGKNPVNLTNSPGDDYWPRWSPDGKQIIFVSERDGNAEIYVMNRDGSGATRLTNDPAYDVEPSWSPDGEQIAFTSDRDGGYNLYIMDIKTKSVEALTHVNFVAFPDWSPDGASILYETGPSKNHYLAVFDLKTKKEKRITFNNSTLYTKPVWSPDGLSFVCENAVSYEEHQVGISIGGYPNGQFASVVEPVGTNLQPTWSPNGSQIAFVSYRYGQRDIYIVSRDGKFIYRVTNDDRIEGMVDWFAE